MRRLTVLFLVLLPFLVACGARRSLSPTPFPTVGTTLTPSGEGPITLTITELAAAPGLYQDAVVQLTGRLRKQPILVCDTDLHQSPATWGLAEEGVLALAGGFDQQVRSLLPDELLVTAEGRWRRWEGIVGCGKQARQQEVWYLDVGRIVSPSPLTQVTLTPGAGGEATAVAGLPPTQEVAATEEGAAFPTPDLEETPELPGSTESPEGYPVATDDSSEVVGSPTATLPTAQTPTRTLTPGASTTATSGTVTGTPTAGGTGTPAGTPTPTVTGTPPTQTPTATSGATGQVVPKGDLVEDLFTDFIVTTVAAGTIDSWDMALFSDESMYVYAVALAPVDIILSVLKDGETIIDRQNTAPAGSPEVLNAPTLEGEGTYEVHVIVDGGGSAEYAITAHTEPEFAATIAGANAGDNVTLRLDPLDNTDAGMYLFDSGGEDVDSMDDGAEGEEELLEITLDASGLYAIGVDEFFGDPMSYDLELTIQ
jgi:hypothetical protein